MAGALLAAGAYAVASTVAENIVNGEGVSTKPTGSYPNSLDKKYTTDIKNKEIDAGLWYIDGENWHEVFGYRFSVAFVKNGDVNESLSSTPKEKGTLSKITDVTDALGLGGVSDLIESSVSAFQFGSIFPSNSDLTFTEENLDFRHFTLPIPPQSMVVKPIIPSRITPTFGGVVEEVSKVKLWTISMSGTTGTGVSQTAGGFNDLLDTTTEALKAATGIGNDTSINRNSMAKRFREVIETTGLVSGKQGILKTAFETDLALSAATNTLNALSAGDVSQAKSSVEDALIGAKNLDYLPKTPFSSSSVSGASNGFVEIQELQKFFYSYHALKDRHPNSYALLFTNSKTDQSWRCSVKDFVIQQSAENPFLYRYQINLQCWDVRSSKEVFTDTALSQPFDRFGPGGDLFGVDMVKNENLSKKLKKMTNPYSQFGS